MSYVDSISLWVIGIVLVATFSVIIELGYQLGSRVVVERGLSKHPVESAVCNSLLGLMAFMMAFTFGASVTRCSKLRDLALADANVAGRLSLVTDTLPEVEGNRSRELVKEYVEIRSSAIRGQDPQKIKEMLGRSLEIQKELWQIGNEIRREAGGAAVRLYTSEVLKLIENDTSRQTTAFYNRLPAMIWIILGFLAMLAFMVLGLSSGLHGQRSRLVATVFIVAYAFVFVLIVDLDRPMHSLFTMQDPATHILEKLF